MDHSTPSFFTWSQDGKRVYPCGSRTALGSAPLRSHTCHLCGSLVDASGVHGLSCRRSQGCIPRHKGLNTLIKHALAACNIPAVLEPQGLSRLDNKRPDGLTIVPWEKGCSLVWDVTVWNTFAPTYLPLSSSAMGLVADRAADKKRSIYRDLASSHIVMPVALESSGVLGRDTLDFLSNIARRSKSLTTYLPEAMSANQCMGSEL